MSFASFYLKGELELKRQKKDNDNRFLTPLERGIFANLNIKFMNNTQAKDIFNLAPDGIDDPNARQVLVALQDMLIKEISVDKCHFDAISQQLALVDTENRGLKRSNEQLQAANERVGPIQKILDDSKSLQDMIFKQAATENQLREQVRGLEQRIIQASTFYKGEKEAMRNQAIQKLEDLHWDFLDRVVDARKDVSDELRDCIISFMEKARQVLNNF